MKNYQYQTKLINEMPRAKELWDKLCSISQEQKEHNERLAILADEEEFLRDEFDGYLSVMTGLWEAEEKAKQENMDKDVRDEWRDNLIASENEYGT